MLQKLSLLVMHLPVPRTLCAVPRQALIKNIFLSVVEGFLIQTT